MYFEAYILVSILAWQHYFLGLYSILNLAIWKAEKTYITMYSYAGCALLNIILNYFLIKIFGYVGAAIATTLSYLALIMITFIISNRLWDIKFPIFSSFLKILFTFIIILFLLNKNLDSLYEIFLFHLFIVIVFLFFLGKKILQTF